MLGTLNSGCDCDSVIDLDAFGERIETGASAPSSPSSSSSIGHSFDSSEATVCSDISDFTDIDMHDCIEEAHEASVSSE